MQCSNIYFNVVKNKKYIPGYQYKRDKNMAPEGAILKGYVATMNVARGSTF